VHTPWRQAEAEPGLGPTREDLDRGAEPADVLYVDPGWPPDAPEPADVLDMTTGAAEARRAVGIACTGGALDVEPPQAFLELEL
jgi:hypothetical protein